MWGVTQTLPPIEWHINPVSCTQHTLTPDDSSSPRRVDPGRLPVWAHIHTNRSGGGGGGGMSDEAGAPHNHHRRGTTWIKYWLIFSTCSPVRLACSWDLSDTQRPLYCEPSSYLKIKHTGPNSFRKVYVKCRGLKLSLLNVSQWLICIKNNQSILICVQIK